MLKISITIVLALFVAACGDDVLVDQGADGGLDARAADAGVDAPGPSDARPPADAEILEDCAIACPGEELSTWDDYEICRPSYHRCRLAPRCADICDAQTPLTCSSANNCQCHKAVAVITCVNNND